MMVTIRAGVRYHQSFALKRGFCVALLDGKKVWLGLQSQMPRDIVLDEIFMNLRDIIDMESRARKQTSPGH